MPVRHKDIQLVWYKYAGISTDYKWHRFKIQVSQRGEQEKGLIINAPKNMPTDYSHCFKITLEGYKERGIGGEDG